MAFPRSDSTIPNEMNYKWDFHLTVASNLGDLLEKSLNFGKTEKLNGYKAATKSEVETIRDVIRKMSKDYKVNLRRVIEHDKQFSDKKPPIISLLEFFNFCEGIATPAFRIAARQHQSLKENKWKTIMQDFLSRNPLRGDDLKRWKIYINQYLRDAKNQLMTLSTLLTEQIHLLDRKDQTSSKKNILKEYLSVAVKEVNDQISRLNQIKGGLLEFSRSKKVRNVKFLPNPGHSPLNPARNEHRGEPQAFHSRLFPPKHFAKKVERPPRFAFQPSELQRKIFKIPKRRK